MADPFNTPVSDDLASLINVEPLYTPIKPEPITSPSFSEPTVKVSPKLENIVGSPESLTLKANNYSLTDLENDEEFNQTAARFLQSVGEKSLYGTDEDIFEYLREVQH